MKVGILILSLFLFTYYKCISQATYDFYISNSGSDNNSGNSILSPRQTISGSDALFKKTASTNGIVNIGLKSGNIFNDGLITTYPLQLSTYYDTPDKKKFAILNGTDSFDSGWVKQDSTLNTYQQNIAYSPFDGQPIGNYSNIFVIEIDKELEKTEPITARRPLFFAPSQAAVDTIPGSFYQPLTTANPMPVYIHTSNGNSPNSNPKYRYEVTTRYCGIYGYNNSNNRFENLWVRGYGAGYGLIPSGDNTYCNNIIFGPGAAIHHIVLKNGIINNSLFFPASNINDYAIVFYNAYGSGKRNLLSNSMFLDVVYPMYSHTSFPDNYASLTLDSVIALADTSSGGVFLNTTSNDSVLLNNVYVDNYNMGYENNDAQFTNINNSYFKDVGYGLFFSKNAVTAFVNNVFIKAYVTGIAIGSNNSFKLTNSIIHMRTPLKNDGAFFIASSGDTSNYITATNNIFICDTINNNYTVMATANTNNGIATTHDIWNNNVYILLKGSKMYWTITNRATNGGNGYISDFSDWQKQSGQDKNSLFFDLNNDPRGLKAIFIDPDNGDYELANTPEADEIRALHAGMTNPITCFLQKPTYEAAADLIMNGKMIAINSCRNPCLLNNIRVNYKFNPAILNNQQIQLRWTVSEQQNIDHFEIEKAIGDFNYTTIDSTVTTADSTYSFVDDNIKLNTLYNYRLVVVAKNGDRCYSANDSVRTVANKHFIDIYPNPSPGNIMISLPGYTGIASFTITNTVGQIILERVSSLQNGTPQSFNLSNESPGLYYLKLYTIDGTYIQRFIKVN